jgi:hypothetical protein
VSIDQVVRRQRERHQKAMAMRERARILEEQRTGRAVAGADVVAS